MSHLVLTPPTEDPESAAEWVHRFTRRLAELAVNDPAPGSGGSVATAVPPAGQQAPAAPALSDVVEAMLGRLTKRGAGKTNAGLLRQLLLDLTAAGLALTPAPDPGAGKRGQPYVRVHRPAGGRGDTAVFVHASYVAFTGALPHVSAASAGKLTHGQSMVWLDLSVPGAAGIVVDACIRFMNAA